VIFLLSLVSLSNMMVSDYNFQKGSMLFSYLDGKGGEYDGDGNIIVKAATSTADLVSSETAQAASSNLVKVASADNSFWGNPSAANSQDQGDDQPQIQTISSGQTQDVNFSPMLVQEDSVVSPASYYDENSDDSQKYGIIKYTVQDGDTPSSIADSFGISTYTVLWANNLKVGQLIKPGQVLDILPVTGVKHLVTEKDTIDSIAQKYKADVQEIIIFNELPANGKLTPGRILIVPNGEMEQPVNEPKPQPTNTQGQVVSSTKVAYTNVNPSKGHRFPYGQCTWYVSTRFYVPWGGNAKAWLANAGAYGYSTGKTPVPGSIVVTSESRFYGHVAFVESVTPSTITISEMNFVGWARKSIRVLDRNSGVIRGYIYPKK
jgi:surface antigen